MAKITVTVCDVKPCKMNAERHFQINGRMIHVCGEGCYAKYWSREYRVWNQNRYDMQATQSTATVNQVSGRVLKLVSNNK